MVVTSVGSGAITRTKDDSSMDIAKSGAQRKVESELGKHILHTCTIIIIINSTSYTCNYKLITLNSSFHS